MSKSHLVETYEKYQKKLEETEKLVVVIQAKMEGLLEVIRLYQQESQAKVPQISTLQDAVKNMKTTSSHVFSARTMDPETHKLVKKYFEDGGNSATPTIIYEWAKTQLRGKVLPPNFKKRISSVLQSLKYHGLLECVKISDSQNPRDRVWVKTLDFKHDGGTQ